MESQKSSAARKKQGKFWIAGAINPAHKGLLHKELRIPKEKKIPEAKLASAAHGNSPLAKRARLAMTLRKMNK